MMNCKKIENVVGSVQERTSGNNVFSFSHAFIVGSSYQPPALFLAIAVIQIDLENVSFRISHNVVAAVSARVPFTAAAWKSAEPVLAELSGNRVKKLLFWS
ncbi:MAG: hypothetical protein MUP30_06010 [Deltaproteobacteria bacterium]|nr:hypothetical protein [Deltaproteobacteria bacterium]